MSRNAALGKLQDVRSDSGLFHEQAGNVLAPWRQRAMTWLPVSEHHDM